MEYIISNQKITNKFMTEMQNREWKRALWSVVVAALLAIGANFWMNVQFQATVKEQNRVMELEINLLRSKIDHLGIQVEHKVDRETLDNCLRDISQNVESTKATMEKNFTELNKLILDMYKNRR